MKNILAFLKKITTNQSFISIIMACFSYSSICLSGIILTYNIMSWLVFFSLIMLYLKTEIFNKKLKKEILCLSILFSFIIVYGGIAYSLMDNSELSIFSNLFSMKSLFNFIGSFNFIYIILTNFIPKIYSISIKNNKSIIKKSWIIFVISFFVILICWLPYFLTFYPGTISSDSLGELSTVINNFTNVSDHHPVLHILFISVPYNIGYAIFGNITSAVAVVTVSQMIILSSIFSSLIVFLYNRKIRDIILFMVMIFYALIPMHGYYSIVMWKDVLFSGLLLLLTMQTIRIIEKEQDRTLSFKKLIGFIITSILCVFFRNNAIYMYMILAIVTLIIFRKYYKIFIGAFLIVFLTYYIIKGPVFDYFNILKSASAEYIGMPLQQIGRMAFKNVDFTDEEEILINDLMPIEIMKDAYNPRISDGIKFNKSYNGIVFDENKMEYLKLWLNLVKKYPGVALESYSMSTLGYWYPGVEYWSVSNSIWENDYSLVIDSKTPKTVQNFISSLESRRAPILNIQWSIGFCFWLILIFGMLSFKKIGIKGLYSFVPIFGIWITMMLASPVFGEFRYVYGAFTCLPILIIIPYLFSKKKIKR